MRATSRGSLKERADVDVEAQVGEGGGDHLGAAVVAVLAHLGHQNARAAAFGAGELFGQCEGLLEFRIAPGSPPSRRPKSCG